MADITRADVANLIQEEYSATLLEQATVASTALTAFDTVPLSTKITNLPVLTSLPEAGWVSESSTDAGGVKPTSKATWGSKRFVVEEIAVIVPIHEDVLEDSTENLLGIITKLGGQAIGKTLDEAVFFGVGKPVTWSDPDLFALATAAGEVYQVGTGENDLAGVILQSAGSIADHGGTPDTLASSAGLQFRLANLRDAQGSPVYLPTLNGGVGGASVYGLNAAFVKNGAWDNTKAAAIVADKSRIKIGIRQDVTVKFLDQATVGGVNLAERDMVALRFKARFGYAVGNVIGTDGTAYVPTAVITPAAG